MINKQLAEKTKENVELRRVGPHRYQLWINGEMKSVVAGRENIFKLREAYPEATVTLH